MKKQPQQTLAIERVEDLLAYRLPQSGKALGSIVLSRAVAEQLVKEWYAMQQLKGATGSYHPSAK
jgi:hypothetical protein